MTIVDVVAWLFLFLPILPLAVVVVLAEYAWGDNMALRERVGVAIRDLVMASVVSVASANYLFDLNLPDPVIWVLFVTAFFAISIPSLIWLVIYFRWGFR